MIHVEDYHKAYERTLAVAGLSFHVAPGEILGLVGPNGAGKTTTLRAVAGILEPSRGRLVVAGHDVATEPVAAKGRLAYIPDDPQLFDALTVGEHLEFIAAAYRVDDWEPRADELLEFFELTPKRNTPAEALSRGMRQKLAICCGYLHRPAAILFDEPLTGLDPLGIRRLNESIRQRAAEGSAIIVSSHLLAMVEDLCTHLLILTHGRARFHGPRDDLHAEYATETGESSLEEIFFRATEEWMAVEVEVEAS